MRSNVDPWYHSERNFEVVIVRTQLRNKKNERERGCDLIVFCGRSSSFTQSALEERVKQVNPGRYFSFGYCCPLVNYAFDMGIQVSLFFIMPCTWICVPFGYPCVSSLSFLSFSTPPAFTL